MLLAGDRFLNNTGVNLKLARKLNRTTDASLETKYADQNYLATPDVASNPERRGGLFSVSAGAGRLLNPTMKLNAEITGSAKRAGKKYNAYNGLSLGFRHSWLLGKGMFLLSSISAESDSYLEADAVISDRKRKDTVLRGGLLYGLPVSMLHKKLKNLTDLTLTLNCEHFRSKSNVLNYTYVNNKAALLLTYRWELGI